MAMQAATSVTCPQCKVPFTAPIMQIVDGQSDHEAKSRLLSGHLNLFICPHCGLQGVLDAPFLYHDAELELALVYMPMKLGAADVQRQKAIGDLTNRLMQQLPPEERKGYLLQPRTFFSIENLVEAMLERDEATRELVEMQQRKMELLEQLHKIDPGDSLAVAAFVGDNDSEIDESFLQLLDVMIGIAESRGDAAEHDKLERLQASLLEKSSLGRLLKAQREAIEALTADPTRETLIEQLVAAEDKVVRETLVTVGRQLLDYAFFQALTARIDAARDTATSDRLKALRKEVQEIRDQIDARSMEVLNSRARLLRDLMASKDPRELLMRHISEVDDAFLGVLNTNMQQAASEGRTGVVEQLRKIGDMAVGLLAEHLPPEIKLINRLANAESNEQVEQLLDEEGAPLNQVFLEVVQRAVVDVEQAGNRDRLERLRYAAARIKERIAA